MEGGTRLYLHVFEWPLNGKLIVPGLGSDPIRSYILNDPDQKELKVTRERDALYIEVPDEAPDQYNSVVVIDIIGDPVVYLPPKIESSFSSFVNELEVSIGKEEDKSTIRYTLDGSEPDSDSPVYSIPLRINKTTTIGACCFLNGQPVSNTVFKTFEKVIPLPGKSITGLKNGLKYNYYEGDWDSVPSYSGLVPKKQGVAENFDLAAKETEENFSLDYQGFIDIPEDAVYIFYLTSDDGSILYIGEDEIINNDGLHSPTEKSSEIALGKGIHSIRISFFEKTGGNLLNLSWKSQGMEKQKIPANKLFHTN
jgi:alpha-L-fucosidase